MEKERFRDSMTDRLGLASNASAMDIDRHIKLISSSCEIEGLENNHLTGLPPKITLQRPLIDNEFSFPGFEPNPCNGCLSFACSINGFCHVFSPFHPLSPRYESIPTSPLEGEGWEGGLFSFITSVQARRVSEPRGDDSDLRRPSVFEASVSPNCSWEASPGLPS